MITGRVHHRVKVFTPMAPYDNEAFVIPVKYALVAGVPYNEDFTVGQMDHVLPTVQSFFVDNSQNSSSLAIYFPVSDYTIEILAFSQGTYPVYSADGAKAVITSAAAAQIQILWCNFLQPYYSNVIGYEQGTATDGSALPLNFDSLPQVLTYNGDSTVHTIVVTNGTNSWTQTYGYTAGLVTSISGWVKS